MNPYLFWKLWLDLIIIATAPPKRKITMKLVPQNESSPIIKGRQ